MKFEDMASLVIRSSAAAVTLLGGMSIFSVLLTASGEPSGFALLPFAGLLAVLMWGGVRTCF